MFEQLGNFTKNNLTHNTKLVKEKENKTTANHVAVGGAGGEGNQNPSPSHKHGQPPPPLKKPFKLRNVASKAECYDTLYGNSTMVSFFYYFAIILKIRRITGCAFDKIVRCLTFT